MIHFVGAGSGAADLITLRGKKFLEEADVIIYAGSLVNPELLKYAKKECKIYDSAKMTLEEGCDASGRKRGADDGASAHRRSVHLRCDPGADGCAGCRKYFL